LEKLEREIGFHIVGIENIIPSLSIGDFYILNVHRESCEFIIPKVPLSDIKEVSNYLEKELYDRYRVVIPSEILTSWFEPLLYKVFS